MHLRIALVKFLRGWHLDWPATTEDASSIPEVMNAKRSLLPKGVSLRAWIDQRLGGEIETAQPPEALQASIVFLALRGSMISDVSEWVTQAAESLKTKRGEKRRQAEADGRLPKNPRC